MRSMYSSRQEIHTDTNTKRKRNRRRIIIKWEKSVKEVQKTNEKGVQRHQSRQTMPYTYTCSSYRNNQNRVAIKLCFIQCKTFCAFHFCAPSLSLPHFLSLSLSVDAVVLRKKKRRAFSGYCGKFTNHHFIFGLN